jgi:hypothetical protein
MDHDSATHHTQVNLKPFIVVVVIVLVLAGIFVMGKKGKAPRRGSLI